jgi:hypothetical protein
LFALTITMTRIGPPPWLGAALVACSTHTSFGGTGNRHHLPRKNSLAIAAAGSAARLWVCPSSQGSGEPGMAAWTPFHRRLE